MDGCRGCLIVQSELVVKVTGNVVLRKTGSSLCNIPPSFLVMVAKVAFGMSCRVYLGAVRTRIARHSSEQVHSPNPSSSYCVSSSHGTSLSQSMHSLSVYLRNEGLQTRLKQRRIDRHLGGVERVLHDGVRV